MGTGTTVALVLGGAALVGGGVYLATRRRTPAYMPAMNLRPLPPPPPPIGAMPRMAAASAIVSAGPKVVATSSPSLEAQAKNLLASHVGGLANKFLPGSGQIAASATKKVVGIGGKALSNAASAAKSAISKLKFW